jgi:CubicO group peptidase (beta-lactamase class C family)
MDQGKPILSADSARLMITEQVPGYGLGWRVDGEVIHHSGSSGTHAWAALDRGLAAVVYFQYVDEHDQVRDYQDEFWKRVSSSISNSE